MIYFTSDTHFGHYNIIKYCNRLVSEHTDDHTIARNKMTEILITNWNSIVGPKDEVYHLGDVSFYGTNRTKEIVNCLNGRKYLIRGNHDKKDNAYWITMGFEWVRDYFKLKVHTLLKSDRADVPDKQYHQPIVLCHYPLLSWDSMAYGSWHLHGHCHGSIDVTFNNEGKRKDVGVDTNNLKPYSYEEIASYMNQRTLLKVDHHYHGQ